MRQPLAATVVLIGAWLLASSPVATARELDVPNPEMDPLASAPAEPTWPIEGTHLAYIIEVSSPDGAERTLHATIGLEHTYRHDRWRGTCDEALEVRERSEAGSRASLRIRETRSVINIEQEPPRLDAPGQAWIYPSCEPQALRVGPAELGADGRMHAAAVDDDASDVTWDPVTRVIHHWNITWEGARIRGAIVDATNPTSLP